MADRELPNDLTTPTSPAVFLLLQLLHPDSALQTAGV